MPVGPSQKHQIWYVIWPGLQALDLTGPHEVFEAANRVADDLGRGGPRYEQRIFGPEEAFITTESGLRIGCEPFSKPGDTNESAPGTIFLPGGEGVHDASSNTELVASTAAFGRRASRVATVCTGTFLAAAAGLLDGRRVATHWARAGRLARQHPSLNVDAESIYVRDGDVWSSAGVTAGIDLALAMVEHDHDAEVAQIAARWLVVHLRRPGGQSQFAAPVWHTPSQVEPVRKAQERIQADPAAPHTVTDLAAAVGMSPRHLSRLFSSEVGESPARFVERVRVEAARQQLERSQVGLTTVAKRCGFGTTETMRRAFQRRLGVAPDDYRRRFQLS